MAPRWLNKHRGALRGKVKIVPVIQILDETKYGKALGMLYRMGGMFWTKHYRTFIIGPGQYQALVEAGLVKPNGAKGRRSGQKKKKKT